MTEAQVIQGLKRCRTFRDFLLYIRDTDGLNMVQDNGWYWLEYNGKEIEGTAKERFVSSSDMDTLMELAGISGKKTPIINKSGRAYDPQYEDWMWK